MTELESIRLDKWLWAARFYKTRSLANDAIAGGKVHVNQKRVKPSKEIKVGDRLSISKEMLTWEICVKAMAKQRRPAQEAAHLYEEDAESRNKRQQQIVDQKEMRQLLPYRTPDRKPNKKDRRMIHRFKQSGENQT